jgi:hypothetical protein
MNCRHGNEREECRDCGPVGTATGASARADRGAPSSRARFGGYGANRRTSIVAKCPHLFGGYVVRAEGERVAISTCPCGAPLETSFVVEASEASPAPARVLAHAPPRAETDAQV